MSFTEQKTSTASFYHDKLFINLVLHCVLKKKYKINWLYLNDDLKYISLIKNNTNFYIDFASIS